MVYKVLGLMSGSSLDGLDIACMDFQETAGKWTFEIIASECIPYPEEWVEKLRTAAGLPARDYQLLHVAYGAYTAGKINAFIEKYSLHHQVHLIAVHGHTIFHLPEQGVTVQLGDGATIAARTELPVVTDLRALDVAFGGQGAPLVPIGEKLLFPEYDLFLNLGGIANISCRLKDDYIAFDVCPANRVLNMLANKAGREYDPDGAMAAEGMVSPELLTSLNRLDYYARPWPKSLSNDFGTDTVFPLLEASGLPLSNCLRTYTAHITAQVKAAAGRLLGVLGKTGPDHSGPDNPEQDNPEQDNPGLGDPGPGDPSHSAADSGISTLGAGDAQSISGDGLRLLATGGGALNGFLVSCLRDALREEGIEVVVPGQELVNYKEALIMGLVGLLRWREEYTVLASVTGAKRNSIGGALWMGTEA